MEMYRGPATSASGRTSKIFKESLSSGLHNVFLKSPNTNCADDIRSANSSSACGDDESELDMKNSSQRVCRKVMKRGFDFSIMVVGESGLGKSTLVKSLLMQDLYNGREFPDVNERIQITTRIEKHQIKFDERGLKLHLTIVDTPGFGDAVDCTESWKPIQNYIDGTFEQYLRDEYGLNRKNIHDNRVHCCLYFISPYYRGLRPIDVEFMRSLQHKVNIIPVISKADALTAKELAAFKERIRTDLDRYEIDIYHLPECDSDEDDDIKRLDKEIKDVIPFALVGSNTFVQTGANQRVRGRQYPWGTVELENNQHCDFSHLRMFLMKTHLQDLVDYTCNNHYEKYRAKCLSERIAKRQANHPDLSKIRGAPSFEKETGITMATMIDQEDLIRKKDKEIERMQQMMQKMKEQLHSTSKRSTLTSVSSSDQIASISDSSMQN